MKKPLIYTLVTVFAFLILSFFTLLFYVSTQTSQPLFYFPKTIIQAIVKPSLNPNFNFILLGLDRRNDWLEKTETTDTIIFTNFNRNNINLISLPRDLWDYALGYKINDIYPHSRDYPNSLFFVKDNFARLTHQPIARLLVITTDNLIRISDIIGGIDVNLETGFKDDQYPNPEYIKNPLPSTPIYKTVEFPSGKNHLNSSNITEFVRSRKSAETFQDGGTDLGRIQRQQLLFDALIEKLKTINYLSSPNLLFRLYLFWHQDIETDFTDHDIFSLLFSQKVNPGSLIISKHQLPIGEKVGEGVIFHPEKFINKQWVFIPSTTDYSSIINFIQQAINDRSKK